MSSALAIASVTYVLKDLLNNGLIDHNVTDATGGNVTVSALPPDLVNLTETNQASRLNLFMYHVTTNQGWRSSGMPSRDSSGDRISNPPLALDLHYLLTAYAHDELHSEILLGYGMQLLHETTVLTRDAIRRSLTSPDVKANDSEVQDPPGNNYVSLPAKLKALSLSELDKQVEQIKITFQPMNTDEMSKLWSAFQSKFRPTAAYQVSVVLIESKKPVRSPLPVLRRGRPEDFGNSGEGITVMPDLSNPLSPYPVLQDIIYPDKQLSACLGDSISMNGINLDGSDVIVRLENKWKKKDLVIGYVSSGQLTFQLPSNKPDEWVPGFYSISVQIRRLGKSFPEVTNQVPFSLAPQITLPPFSLKTVPNLKRADLCDVTTTIQCAPYVSPEQRVSLLLNDCEALAEQFGTATDKVDFVFSALPPGEYLVRLRVDGIDSHFIDYTKKPPEFTKDSKVTIQ